MGHYDDIIEKQEDREREENKSRRTAVAAETRAKIIRIVNSMDISDIEFLKEFIDAMPDFAAGDTKFIIDIMKDLPAYRGFFKVLRGRL